MIRKPILWFQKKYNIVTKGVRVLIICNNKVLLVRHWYQNLWVMPGGGIKKYETPEYAAVRETKEETGIQDIQLNYLLGVYSNTKNNKNDTVYCYVVECDNLFELKRRFNLEIANIGWFDIQSLPEHTSIATHQRIVEYQNHDIQQSIRPWSV